MQSPGQAPRYSGSWVEELNARGFSVCGVDQQGLGFSEGLRGYVERFSDYVADILQFAKCALTRTDRASQVMIFTALGYFMWCIRGIGGSGYQ